MKNLTSKHLILIATAGSIALLGGAFVFQAFGIPPCKMCYWQRYPHAAAILIGALALALGRKWLAWFGAVATFITGSIGVFHSGVERGLWEGPTSCTGTTGAGMSASDLMDQILNAPLIRCDEIAWQMLGFTMPNLNAIISFALVVVWVMAARRS